MSALPSSRLSAVTLVIFFLGCSQNAAENPQQEVTQKTTSPAETEKKVEPTRQPEVEKKVEPETKPVPEKKQPAKTLGKIAAPTKPESSPTAATEEIEFRPTSSIQQQNLKLLMGKIGGRVNRTMAIPDSLGFLSGWDFDLSNVKPENFKAALEVMAKAAPIAALSFPEAMTDEQFLQFITACPELRKVRFADDCRLTNAGYQHLKTAKKLEALDVGNQSSLTTGENWSFLAELTSLESLYLPDSHFPVEAAQYLEPLTNLKELYLYENPISEAAAASLSKLTKLERLDLPDCEIEDASLVHLGKLSRLEHLSLQNCQIGDAGVAHLADLSELTWLDLQDTKISQQSFQTLGKFTKLEYLEIQNLDLGDGSELKHLANLTNLESLDLGGPHLSFTGTGLQHLKNSRITSLDLSECAISDAGLAELKQVKSLEYLKLPPYGDSTEYEKFFAELHPTRLTDVGIQHLCELPNLRSVSLSGGGITDKSLVALAQLPEFGSLKLEVLPNVTGTGFAAFGSRQSFLHLNLRETGMTEEGWKAVGQLKLLSGLTLPVTITKAEVESLKGLSELRNIIYDAKLPADVQARLKELFPDANHTKLDFKPFGGDSVFGSDLQDF